MSKATIKTASGVEITRAEEKKLVIGNIVQVSVDRSPKDIGDYVTAMQNAESVYYPNRAALYDIYHRIVLDGTYTGAWERKRVAKVRNKNLRFEKAGKTDEALAGLIESKHFRDFISLVMEQKAWGLSGAEFIPGAEFKWKEVPRKHINARLRRITRHQYGDEGTSYEGLWNLIVLGNNEDMGFLIKVAPYVLYKQGNWGDWAQFVEQYGQPFRKFTYDLYDEASKQEAFNMARESGNNLAIVIPKQFEFDVVDGKQTNGDGKLQDSFKEALNREVMLIVLGSMETMVAGGGSLAKAKIQSDDQQDVIYDDMKDVLDVLNSAQFLNILQSYGYNVAGGRFEFEKEFNPEELRAETDVDRFLVNDVKLPLAHDYFYERYGRPKPDNYDELVKLQEEKENLARQPVPADGPANNQDDAPKPRTPKPAPRNPKPATAALSFWERIDLRIANFFDPGHKG